MARRLFCEDIHSGSVIVTGPEAHHGKDVLRLRMGDEVELFDGKGGFALAVVSGVERSELHFKVDAIQKSEAVRPIITLATAMPKFAHQETLVKMCTEIGVNDFSPIIYERSAVREQFRPEKWERWSLEACKQCGMNVLPTIHPACSLANFLKSLTDKDLLIIGSTVASSRKLEGVSAVERVVIFIGPEGGFTPEEEQTVLSAGAIPVRVGANILRIETAAVALASVVTFEINSFRA